MEKDHTDIKYSASVALGPNNLLYDALAGNSSNQIQERSHNRTITSNKAVDAGLLNRLFSSGLRLQKLLTKKLPFRIWILTVRIPIPRDDVSKGTLFEI